MVQTHLVTVGTEHKQTFTACGSTIFGPVVLASGAGPTLLASGNVPAAPACTFSNVANYSLVPTYPTCTAVLSLLTSLLLVVL